MRLTAGTYKVTSPIIIDTASQAGQGFRLISDGAVIDGRTIASGPVLQIQCGGGTTSGPTGCFYFRASEGALFVNGNTPAYVVVVGNTDFSDAHNSAKFDHLIVNNANTAPAGGGCQFNYVLELVTFTRFASRPAGRPASHLSRSSFPGYLRAGTAAGTGGRGVVSGERLQLQQHLLRSRSRSVPDLPVDNFQSQWSQHFRLPLFQLCHSGECDGERRQCADQPELWRRNGQLRTALSTGISVIGTGSRDNWLFPVAGSYVAKPIDDGLSVSNYNAPGASMSVTLPALSSVNAGWSMGIKLPTTFAGA